MSDQPLTGAQFARQVGTDPEKWAEAFAQRAAAMSEPLSDGLRDELVGFFRDAMDAAVRAADVHGVLVEPWDQQRTVAQILEEWRRQTGKPSD